MKNIDLTIAKLLFILPLPQYRKEVKVVKIEYAVIGKRIKKCRKQLGYSQESFAEILEISASHLHKIETGIRCPSLEVLYTIALKLNVSVDFLLMGSEQQNHSIVDFNVVMLLRDCRPYEQKVIMALANQLKIALIENRPDIEGHLKQHTINRFHPY